MSWARAGSVAAFGAATFVSTSFAFVAAFVAASFAAFVAAWLAASLTGVRGCGFAWGMIVPPLSSLTWRMNLPRPWSRRAGSGNAAPWKKPTLTWDGKTLA